MQARAVVGSRAGLPSQRSAARHGLSRCSAPTAAGGRKAGRKAAAGRLFASPLGSSNRAARSDLRAHHPTTLRARKDSDFELWKSSFPKAEE
ncbi:hypothetical protein WJX81_005838 [Elliptochloris bilobata]|uniref:Uncharacterized protein n=1 Tax=Elliptochloris bilobata TaxID=381761 RepID=A0AAW1SH96_9CHLO